MCGIVGYIGDKDVVSVLLVGLERLGYRGYDSAGIAIIDQDELFIRKEIGKIRTLTASLEGHKIHGDIGIGHTRWATHGVPSHENAHPHADCTNTLAIVHNGIIENYHELKTELQREGHVFQSETDSEVIAHLMEKYFNGKGSLEAALIKTIQRLHGAFSIAALAERDRGKIVCARKGSPLVIGRGEDECFISSDVQAIITLTRDILYLDDGEMAILTRNKIVITDFAGNQKPKEFAHIEWDESKVEKGGYEHFMLKEINEQPFVMRDVMQKRISSEHKILIPGLEIYGRSELAKLTRIIIQACGTSWHAGTVAKYWLEKYARIHTEVDISSEFRYRSAVMEGGSMVMAITQSGETADTLAGIREAKSKFLPVISFCNVEGSTIMKESDATVLLNAGTEIGVASTKAYTAQLLALYLFTLYLSQVKWTISEEEISKRLNELKSIPSKMETILAQDEQIKKLALKYQESKNYIFIGRGMDYPTALEGALKMKEISYIHATGYPAGELKHGPIALIDNKIPVVCIAPKVERYEKMLSNVQEVQARHGRIIAIATEGDTRLKDFAEDIIYIPETSEDLTPLLTVIPLQLLAYHTANLLGCDVDQPRNLAKSVTVE